jgi:hypothetical protein
MRFADLLLLAACLLWVAGLFLGQGRNRRFLLGFLAVAGLAGALQVGLNQYRWQLVPAYLLLLAASFTAALRIGGGPARPSPRWRMVVGRILLVVALLIAVGLPVWLFPEIRYERPTGAYQVGYRSEIWVDSTRGDTFTPAPNDLRQLPVRIWYPADNDGHAARVTAYPKPRVLAEALTSALPGGKTPAFVFTSLGSGLTWARADLPVTGAERSFPLLVFSHGLGTSPAHYGFEMAELASHGYVVVSVEHTHTSTGTLLQNGEVVNTRPEDSKVLQTDSTATTMADLWAADGRFVIDRMFALARNDPRQMLTGRIDTTRVGYFGHSFGGTTAANVMAADARVLTGINMDGYLAGRAWINGLDRPFLQMRSDSIDINAIPEEQLKQVGITRDDLRNLIVDWNRRTVSVIRGGGSEVHIKGTAHMNYSDLPLWSPPVSRMIQQAGSIAPRRAHRIINEVTLAWFDRNLKGKGPTIEELVTRYPELELRAGENRTKD